MKLTKFEGRNTSVQTVTGKVDKSELMDLLDRVHGEQLYTLQVYDRGKSKKGFVSLGVFATRNKLQVMLTVKTHNGEVERQVAMRFPFDIKEEEQ